MRILYVTDFSKHARRAADTAALLALRLNSTLLLVSADWLIRVPKPYRGLMHVRLNGHLCSETKRLAQNGIHVHAIPVNDAESHDVINAAVAIRADMIVMPSPPPPALAGWWTLGGINNVVRRASIPVLLIRQAGPLGRWLEHGESLDVLIVHDFAEGADGPLHWLRRFKEAGNCRICRCSCGDAAPDVCARSVAGLGKGPLRIKPRVKGARRDLRVLAISAAEDTGLIIVGLGQHRFRLPLFTLGIVRKAPMNIACVPLAYVPRPTNARRHVQAALPRRRAEHARLLERSGNRVLSAAKGMRTHARLGRLREVRSGPGRDRVGCNQVFTDGV